MQVELRKLFENAYYASVDGYELERVLQTNKAGTFEIELSDETIITVKDATIEVGPSSNEVTFKDSTDFEHQAEFFDLVPSDLTHLGKS